MKPGQKFRVAPHQVRGLTALAHCLPKNSVGVEIGCAYGESMALFMATGRVKELLCVDTWQGSFAEREPYFDRRAAKWPGRVHKAKAASSYVGTYYAQNPEKRFDFVYIDAKHDFKSVSEDIELWRQTLKPGGILAGHDYRNDVKRAVDGIFGKPQRVFEDSTWMVKL